MMLGIVINPKSGKKAYRAQRLYLWKLLKTRHEPFMYRVTRYAGHAIELGRELVEKGCDQIVVIGGDGTLSEVINGIMRANLTDEQRKNLHFGLIPRGTGNDFARFWNLNRDFKRSSDLFFNGKSQPLDVGCITYWRNGIEHHRYFINSVGFGVDPLTCRMAEGLKYYIGSHHVNYLFALFGALVKYKPLHIRLECDEKQVLDERFEVLQVANGPFSGGGMKLNPKADPRDGIFNTMVIGKPTLLMVMKAIPKLFNSELTDLPFVHTFQQQEVMIHTKQHIMFEADGIVMDIMGPCKVTCLKNAIQMIVPQYC